MNLNHLKKYSLPDSPGVYFFYQDKKIIYIGKATSLKDRVRSYFVGDLSETRGPRLVKMLELSNKLKWHSTESVLEALLLETELIKIHQPKYNAREKDDKSYNYIVITKETYPRVIIVRGRDLDKRGFDVGKRSSARYPMSHIVVANSYGPFPNGRDLKIALRLIRKIFPWRDKCLPTQIFPVGKIWVGGKIGQVKPCFEHQIGLCPGVCVGAISPRDYAKTITKLRLIFSGRFKTLKTKLAKEMKALAKELAFEEANKIKKQLFALNHLQDIALIRAQVNSISAKSFRLEAYDIAHLSGTNTVGAMVVYQAGELSPKDYRQFKIKNLVSGQIDDLKNLAEILTRRLKHLDWPLPDLIIVDGDERIRQVAEKICRAYDLAIPVVAVKKDQHHKAEQLLGSSALIRDYRQAIILVNSEAHRYTLAFHRKLRRQLLK
ncbi:MAG: hypothetical protein COX02_00770 [Candidatus Vogelbacteria bacterium CG22_combo_CG10-13_8_21_14_all_37_9]|uniref:Excinuclease ABC subunit C n=1 Tax=Candidatus Vogelbacteria bacterium CG22_combo_CG10-13_8_21_14_all_37_9 TaxID=1975046 RepID=A0A2H0BKY9_9BACT|nr:MAG: hypothetical protein BK005_02290 [bacterium CG10_37_50]PIP58345.1 MAG: hypothetical protein COX02_00770 [Candidatus Vogelbacteria bacterium CG22_combo_CG10-13_8_21_14_all_37_9]